MRKTPAQYRLYLQACDDGRHLEDRATIDRAWAKAKRKLRAVLIKRWNHR